MKGRYKHMGPNLELAKCIFYFADGPHEHGHMQR